MNESNISIEKIKQVAKHYLRFTDKYSIAKKRIEMLEAAEALDKLNIGWNEAEQKSAIADLRSASIY